jgi:PAS domain S-box-containing protein
LREGHTLPVHLPDTFRTALEQVPTGVAINDLYGKYLYVNQRLCEITGYTREELLAADVGAVIPAEDLPGCLELFARFREGNIESYSVEKRYIRKDGSAFWAKLSVAPLVDGLIQGPTRLIAIIDDITEYKVARDRQLKAEEKCSKAFRQTPMAVMIASAIDHRYLEVNEAFERLTGYTRAEAIGRTPMEMDLCLDPEQRIAIAQAALEGKRVSGEYRFRTRDGKVHTAMGYAEPIHIDGEPCVLSAAMDITDRKRLETELQDLAGQLIKTQDEERRRIAMELTDSLGQSVAAVSYEVSHLSRSLHGECGKELHAVSAKIQDIASGIAIISQSLHPSGLDYTGLPWAIEVLCRQSLHLYGLHVGFRHEGVPAFLPPDVALCLYRIVQEGLSNVVEHSGAREAWIELSSNGNEIRLALWDKGNGFDVASTRSGLGLLAMRERSRRLDGEFSIRSQAGTRIDVRIPLRITDDLTPSLDFETEEPQIGETSQFPGFRARR